MKDITKFYRQFTTKKQRKKEKNNKYNNDDGNNNNNNNNNTENNKMKFPIKDFLSKCDQSRSFLRI